MNRAAAESTAAAEGPAAQQAGPSSVPARAGTEPAYFAPRPQRRHARVIDLLDAQKAIMSTELLPGEDPALLPGPDRVELYPVIGVPRRQPRQRTAELTMLPG